MNAFWEFNKKGRGNEEKRTTIIDRENKRITKSERIKEKFKEYQIQLLTTRKAENSIEKTAFFFIYMLNRFFKVRVNFDTWAISA